MYGWIITPTHRAITRAISLIALFLMLTIAACNTNTSDNASPLPSSTPIPEGIFTAEPNNPRPSTIPSSEEMPSSTAIKTMLPGTSTPEPTDTIQTATEEIVEQFVPQLGGADTIAFLNGGEIWIANLDASGLRQRTDDGREKSSLHWSQNGEYLFFISGNCINTLNFETSLVEEILCFEESQELISFTISPDGRQAAISLDYQLFIVPYEPSLFSGIRNKSALENSSNCMYLSPYKHRQSIVRVSRAYWSKDGSRLAILRQGYEDSGEVEIIHLLDITRCISPLPRLDEFPATRFQMENYQRVPILQDFTWDGSDLFAMTDFKRNDGFGDLWIYNNQLHRGFKANPVEGKCCYRDAVFSPDGKYLAFVFQDSNQPADGAKIYYIPYGAIDSSLVLPPLELPEGFFTDPRTKPQPALRPVPTNEE